MNNKRSIFSSIGILQLALALFFTLSGLLYLINYDSLGMKISRFFGNDHTMATIIAIVQLAAALVLLVALFARVSPQVMFISGLAIMIIWTIIILNGHFFNNFLAPNFLNWLRNLSADLIVLAALFVVTVNRS